MNVQLEHTIGRWLHNRSVDISSHLLKEKLQTHPDYPSLLAITDALDELGIENMSLVVDKEKLDELPLPFLTHSPLSGGFTEINNIEHQIRKDKDFEKNWNGIVVLVEKPPGWHHTENEKALTKHKTKTKQIFASLSFVIFFAVFSLFDQLSFSSAALLVVSAIGLAIAIFIVQQELGIGNELTEQLCKAGKATDCNAVIHYKGSKLSKWLNWPDVGIIYFSSFLFTLVAMPANPLLSFFSAAAILFIFFSVYYQWRVVKKWCTLCLLTVAVLTAQFALLLPAALNMIKNGTEIISVESLAFTSFIFSTIATAWLWLIKPVLQKNKELADKNYPLQRFKNNPDIFKALLRQQRKVDTTPFEKDLHLGNPDAHLQIMVACNPYCRPCASTHEALHQLAEKNDIGLTNRFTIKTGEQADKKTEAVAYLLQVLQDKPSTYKKQVLYDWYAWMDMEKFKENYPIEKITDAAALLQQQEQWSEQAEIIYPYCFH